MKYVYGQISNYRIIEKAMVENISLLTWGICGGTAAWWG